MRLRHPNEGDFRPLKDSPAEAYGCQTFAPDQAWLRKTNGPPAPTSPSPGNLLLGTALAVGGLISVDTIWDAELIQVQTSVEIAENVTLSITPGTRVEFEGFFRLLVRGRLWAVGEPDQRIIFTASEEQQIEGWDGIEFLNVPALNDSSRLEHCHLSHAVARADKYGTARAQTGGAVSIVGVNKLAIAACEFTNNRAEYGAAIYCGYGSSPVLAGNLIHHNTALWNGSALFSVYAYPKLINNTIVDNTCLAESEFHLGTAVENFNGKIVLLNNIIRGNATNHYSGAQLVEPRDFYTQANNIEGYLGNMTNIDRDPEFRGTGAHPYQLSSDSSCIDLGQEDDLMMALAPFDLSGKNRLCGPALDLGAYEYCSEPSAVLPEKTRTKLTCVPNPFNPRTRILFELGQAGPVHLAIYDLKGHLVETLLDGWQDAGHHETIWDGKSQAHQNQSSGIYLYRLQTEKGSLVRTMTLLR